MPDAVPLAGRAVDSRRPTSQGRDNSLIWRTRAPISIYGPTAGMERSEPLAGVSRRPSAVPDIDPRAGSSGADAGLDGSRFCAPNQAYVDVGESSLDLVRPGGPFHVDDGGQRGFACDGRFV